MVTKNFYFFFQAIMSFLSSDKPVTITSYPSKTGNLLDMEGRKDTKYTKEKEKVPTIHTFSFKYIY